MISRISILAATVAVVVSVLLRSAAGDGPAPVADSAELQRNMKTLSISVGKLNMRLEGLEPLLRAAWEYTKVLRGKGRIEITKNYESIGGMDDVSLVVSLRGAGDASAAVVLNALAGDRVAEGQRRTRGILSIYGEAALPNRLDGATLMMGGKSIELAPWEWLDDDGASARFVISDTDLRALPPGASIAVKIGDLSLECTDAGKRGVADFARMLGR